MEESFTLTRDEILMYCNKKFSLVITSIADQENLILKEFTKECEKNDIPFILIGDTKSPQDFSLEGCNFYSLEGQKRLHFNIANIIPEKHYARKNLGYLIAIEKGTEVIVETDDDNHPRSSFWEKRERYTDSFLLENKGWVNIYKYFSDAHIWPRGFALEKLKDSPPDLLEKGKVLSPIQQGLADENPDVDAVFRLLFSLPVTFDDERENIALGQETICPFNSQNTTWFKEAFSLLYLPSYCSFRMTDIWRSFVAQRIAWECDWNILFHKATVWQDRNEHDLMKNFKDEISGYTNNLQIVKCLKDLSLQRGIKNISENMIQCYEKLIEMKLIDEKERVLLNAWLKDIENINRQS